MLQGIVGCRKQVFYLLSIAGEPQRISLKTIEEFLSGSSEGCWFSLCLLYLTLEIWLRFYSLQCFKRRTTFLNTSIMWKRSCLFVTRWPLASALSVGSSQSLLCFNWYIQCCHCPANSQCGSGYSCLDLKITSHKSFKLLPLSVGTVGRAFRTLSVNAPVFSIFFLPWPMLPSHSSYFLHSGRVWWCFTHLVQSVRTYEHELSWQLKSNRNIKWRGNIVYDHAGTSTFWKNVFLWVCFLCFVWGVSWNSNGCRAFVPKQKCRLQVFLIKQDYCSHERGGWGSRFYSAQFSSSFISSALWNSPRNVNVVRRIGQVQTELSQKQV